MNPLGMWTSFKSTLDSYTSVLGRRFLSVIWVGGICAAIWFMGPRLVAGDFAPLVPERNRIIAIAVVIVGWLIWLTISFIRNRRANRALEDAATLSPEDLAASDSKAEIAELRGRLTEAMKMMRKVARKRFGYAYEFPWYLMMGAPGAGKTTLLTKSGLQFPLGDALGAEPLQGVGGTKNCNWWFTDRAILIDTAGRYTTQDTGHERDSKGFLGFLAMLRKSRKQQPINGIVLTLSLNDLLTQSPEARLQEVRSIRQRLAEVEDTLDARVPVYLVLTKADRLTGFARFFDVLGQQARTQVWGITFPVDPKPEGGMSEIFSREYQALLERLNAMLLERLQQETDINQRGRIFRFPAQVGALHDALQEIVEELSSGNAKMAPPLLRGIYLASATQDEQTMAQTAVPGVPQTARSMNRTFFVERLFGEVILGEAALVGRDRRVSRRKRIAMGIGYGLTAVLALGLIGSWLLSYQANRVAMADIEATLESFRDEARDIAVADISEPQFGPIVEPLNTLERATDTFGEVSLGPVPIHRIAYIGNNISQIREKRDEAYNSALRQLLLPRYIAALQQRLMDETRTPQQTFETLKHYRALFGEGGIDTDSFMAEAQSVFDETLSGRNNETRRERLMVHMANLIALPDLTINGNGVELVEDDLLVLEARARIIDITPGQRVVALLESRAVDPELRDWAAENVVGSNGRDMFRVAQLGEPLPGVDLLYTREGYISIVLPQLMDLSRMASREWPVTGLSRNQMGSPDEIAQDAIDVYFDAFNDAWDTAILDLEIADVDGLPEALELVRAASSSADPLRQLAQSLAVRTSLGAELTDDEIAGWAAGINMRDIAGDLPFDWQSVVPNRRFEPLQELMLQVAAEGEDPPNPLGRHTEILQELERTLTSATLRNEITAELLTGEGALAATTQELLTESVTLPEPMANLYTGIGLGVAAATAGEARASARDLWNENEHEACGRIVDDRYPFDQTAIGEVRMQDFNDFFGHGGRIDTFFNEYMAEFVNTNTDPWSWDAGLGFEGASTEALEQFQRAEEIKTAFFGASGTEPEVELSVEFVRHTGDATAVRLGVGNALWAHLMRTSRTANETLIWPPVDGPEEAYILTLPGSITESTIERGTWSLFRLIDLGEVRQIDDDQFDITFNLQGRTVTLRLTVNSVYNPFFLEALGAFSCPTNF